MSRLLFFALLFSASVQFASAQRFPKFPQQGHVTNATAVKNYWTRTLRWQARSTRSRTVKGDKQRLIERIEVGLYDEQAELVAQRSNLAFLEFKDVVKASQR